MHTNNNIQKSKPNQMFIETILDEMEKYFAAFVGVISSIVVGEKINPEIQFEVYLPFYLQFLLELLSKTIIAVVSGVTTYYAINLAKKIVHRKPRR